MSSTLPFGTSVVCIAHERFEQAKGRVLGFDPINEKYFIGIDKNSQAWFRKELVVPVENTLCLE
jgi:hypothetical protein